MVQGSGFSKRVEALLSFCVAPGKDFSSLVPNKGFRGVGLAFRGLNHTGWGKLSSRKPWIARLRVIDSGSPKDARR